MDVWKAGLASAILGITGGLGGWVIGRAADSTVDAIVGPLAVDVETYGGFTYLLPAQVPQLQSSADVPDNDLARWALRNQGSPANPFIRLEMYGLADNPVLIRDIRVAEVVCSPLSKDIDWTLAIQAGGGYFPELPMSFDLSTNDTSASGTLLVSEDPQEGKWKYPRQVSRAEADGFLAKIQAPKAQECQFVIEVRSTSRGEESSVTVTNNGRPFVASDSSFASAEYEFE